MKHIWHFDSGYSESETKLMSNCKHRFCPSAVTPEPRVGRAAQHFQGLVNYPLRSWCTAAKQFLKRKGKGWRRNKALKSSSETLNMDRISHSWQSWTCKAGFVPATPQASEGRGSHNSWPKVWSESASKPRPARFQFQGRDLRLLNMPGGKLGKSFYSCRHEKPDRELNLLSILYSLTGNLPKPAVHHRWSQQDGHLPGRIG